LKPAAEIKGYFLSFTDEEFSGVQEELKARDYSADPAGLKEFIMDELFAPEEELENPDKNIGEKIAGFIKENPALVNMGMNTLERLIKRATPRK
jgi:hypothetical protein